MIRLNRLHGAGEFVINADLIETMEACPDTTIQLMTRRRFVVQDSIDEVIAKIVEYRARTVSLPSVAARALEHADEERAA